MFADEEFGRLIDALEASPHADNTIVVVTSDHGFHLGQKQHLHKLTLWDDATRVPMLVRLPKQQQAIVRDDAVSLLDVFPTLIDLAGLPKPGSPALAGHSLRTLLESADPVSWPHGVINSVSPHDHSLRTSRWRFTRYADGSEELYDMRDDPHELHNLADDESHHEKMQIFRSRLVRQLEWSPSRRT